MTETIRYSKLGREDVQLEPRNGTFQVTLADGSSVSLNALDIAYMIHDVSTKATLPNPSIAGRLYRVTDSIGGLWMDSGTQWVQVTGGYADVRILGATGDGSTNDVTAIQAAIDAVALTPFGIVFFPPGTYLLNGTRQGTYNTLLVLKSNVEYRGSGYNSVLKIPNGYTSGGDYSTLAPLTNSAINNVTIRDMRFDGNGLNNLVLGSSGANIRAAYSVKVPSGGNVLVENCWFQNNPGRGVLNFGNNSNPASLTNVRIIANTFSNVGGSIAGNSLQDDHSSIYLQTDPGLVADNIFYNDSPMDPTGLSCVALEIHGSNTIVRNNHVKNFEGGGNIVASVHDSVNNIWEGNTFKATSNVLGFFHTGFKIYRLIIRNNIIQIDNSTYIGGTGIFQNITAGITDTQIEDLLVEGNTIYSTVTTGANTTWHGMQFTALKGARIRNNKIKNAQACGIRILPSTTTLNVTDVSITDNDIENVGFHTPATLVFAIQVTNTDTGRLFGRIFIDNNYCWNTVSTGAMRGINITGPGHLEDVTIGALNRFYNIANPTLRVSITTPTNNRRVFVVPRIYMNPRAADPTDGFFENGEDIIYHTDPVTGGYIGKIPSTTGGAVGATWGATTAYTLGQWVSTSANQVLECILAGTSGGIEPSGATFGEIVADGTVAWVYRYSALAVFKTFGVIS